MFLEAMTTMNGTDTHVYDVPFAVITDLLTDLLHTAIQERGQVPDDVYWC
jgi:hypothetical protein